MMISFLLPDLRGGGAERITVDLAHSLSQLGYSAELVLMQARGEFLEEARRKFSVVDLATPRSRQLPKALTHYLRYKRPAALIAAMWPLTIIAPLAACLAKTKTRVLVSEHNMLSIQYAPRGPLHNVAMRASMAAGYRLAHARVGVSAGVADDIARLTGLKRNRFEVIHNPVPPRAVPAAHLVVQSDAMWNGPRGKRIITVGSFKSQKNHKLLLSSFARITDTGARLMFVGTGAGEVDLRIEASKLGIANRVIFAGFHRDPTPFYDTADLFTLSSDREGLPTVIVEALACGLPVVSTDCPSGPAEILENGRFGRLVPVNDADALAQAMVQALAEPYDREALKARARDFAPEKAAKAYLAALGIE